MSLLYLSRQDVQQTIAMSQAIDLMRDAFRELSAHRTVTPQRTHLLNPDGNGHFLTMPVFAAQQGQFALKTVTVFPGNPARNLPAIHALVMLFDGATGRPLALMDGEWLTALRTGAASGLATKLLANPDAAIGAIAGAGSQANAQLEAVASVRPIERFIVLNRSKDKGLAFAQKMTQRLGIPVELAPSPEALIDADIVCTATSADQPLFEAKHLKRGVHINAIGGFRPSMQEIPAETVATATVIVDHLEGCLGEAGDLIIPIAKGLITAEDIRGELGELVDRPSPLRQSRDEVTMFKSVGNAIQDLAVASFVYCRAIEMGLGTALPE